MTNLRALIDAAKEHASDIDQVPIYVNTADGKQEVKRSAPQKDSSENKYDPSDITVASDGQLAATLVAEMYEIRATKRLLTEREAAIQSLLENMVGDNQYLALEPDSDPVMSMKYESTTRIRSAAVKEQYSATDYPELYQTVTSRPLRLM